MFRTNNTLAFRLIHTRYCWIRMYTFEINYLKASTDKVKQPNQNKTNKMNISLASTQGIKKEHTGFISVNRDKPVPHNNVLWIIDEAWMDRSRCANIACFLTVLLYLCNKTTSEQSYSEWIEDGSVVLVEANGWFSRPKRPTVFITTFIGYWSKSSSSGTHACNCKNRSEDCTRHTVPQFSMILESMHARME